jgi:hypothetical protein
MKDLASGSAGGGGVGINEAGDVAGNGSFPFIYIDGHGMLDVRKLSADIPDNATGLVLKAINNNRDIAAEYNGVAVLLKAN